MTLIEDIVPRGVDKLEVKYAVIETAALGAAGNEELIAAVTGKKIRVLAILAHPSQASEGTLRSATTAITGSIDVGTGNDGLMLPFNPVGWFETVAGENLDLLNTIAATSWSGCIVYTVV